MSTQWLANCYRFDGDGRVTERPSMDDMRQRVEAGWRASLQP